MRPATYNFKRTLSTVVQLNTQVVPAGWTATGNALHRQFSYKLSDLPDYGDFTSMFAQYRLTGVKLELMFSNTVSGTTTNPSQPGAAQMFSNSQIIMWLAPTPLLSATRILGPDNFAKMPSAKKRLCINGGRPIVTYARLKQRSVTFGGGDPPADDYAAVTPKFIGTHEPHTPHYGQNMCLERADQALFAGEQANYQDVRIFATYYVQCRQVE